VLIPFGIDPANLRALYERLDGLILAGGGDIEPGRYGKQKSLYTDNVNQDRDEAEMLLVQWSLEDDRPLLAICRGHQVLNVALGGTLIQDIREEKPGALRHDPPSDDWFPILVHEVSLTPGSKLHAVLGIDRLGVNSMHHQAIDQWRPGWKSPRARMMVLLKRWSIRSDALLSGAVSRSTGRSTRADETAV
jgi:putative glutamine amidotransferase